VNIVADFACPGIRIPDMACRVLHIDQVGQKAVQFGSGMRGSREAAASKHPGLHAK